MGVLENLLSRRRHLVDRSSTPSPQPARFRHSIRKVLARSAAAAVSIGGAAFEFTSLLSGGKRNYDAPALHASDAGIEHDEEEPRTLHTNHPHTIRVRRMAADLIAAAGDDKTFARHPRLLARIRRPRWYGIDWKVDVNVDWNISAYSRYDGEIRVSLGELYVFGKDADVATTLGHEVAHVLAGHGIEKYKKSLWTSLLVNFTGELLDVPGDKIAWDAWESLYMRPCYFRQEFEADRIGLLLLGAAGYHPRIAPNHWFKIEKMSKSRLGMSELGSDYDDLTATHPPHLIRAHKLMQTKVMNEALELYVQALIRSGKFSGPLDSAASALKFQLACCKFYIDDWFQGVWASLLPRNLWDRVKNSVRNSSVMAYLAQPNSWIRDIVGSFSLPAQAIYRNLSFGAGNTSGWQLHSHINNTFFSQRTMPGEHCANPAYRMIFQGDIGSPCANLPWECWAPHDVKHLVWLLLRGSPELHGLQSNRECLLCNQAPESAVHIACNCSFAKEVWWNILSWVGIPMILPPAVPSVDVWWKHLRSLFPEDKTKAFDTLFMLIVWHLWLERNTRLLGKEKMTSAQLTAKIEQEAMAWMGASANDLGSLLVISST